MSSCDELERILSAYIWLYGWGGDVVYSVKYDDVYKKYDIEGIKIANFCVT